MFLDFVHLIAAGDAAEASRRLQENPALATMRSEVGDTRQAGAEFFLEGISHYVYAGDTALHVAAAAFRRPLAERLVAHGADCRAKNRRGAEPLHYAADANHWDPRAQAATIEYLLSVGADPNTVDRSGVAPLLLERGAKLSDRDGRGRDVRRAATASVRPLLTSITSRGTVAPHR